MSQDVDLTDADGTRRKRSCTQSKKYYVLEDLFKDEDALLANSGSAMDVDKLVFVEKLLNMYDMYSRYFTMSTAFLLLSVKL